MKQSSIEKAIAEIAEKYRQQGYTITIDLSPDLLPKEVGSYRPDFLAHRGDEHVAVEVKSRITLSADPHLMHLAELFRQIPGWRLDIAVVDEHEQSTPSAILSEDETKSRLESADRVATETHDYAGALLLLWTLIEAMLHSRMAYDQESRLVVPNRLAKLAYSLGIVSDEDMSLMEWLVKIRNEVVHGRTAPDVSSAAYNKARNLAMHLMKSSASGSHQAGN
jgi:hypothetical protein